MSDADWSVLPHGPIEKLSSSLWRVEGTLPRMAMKRVMSVAKLADGRLILHNAIALEDSAMRDLERWGEVGFVIVPNGYHRLDAPRFATRYPKAKLVCPPGSRKAVEKKVTVHGTYDLLPADARVRVSILDGVGEQEGVMTVTDDGGASLVFNDAVFNMPHVPGFSGWVLKNVTNSTGGPRVSRLAKMFLVKDKRAFREGLRKLADTPNLTRVIVSHHQMITEAPADVLRAVAASV